MKLRTLCLAAAGLLLLGSCAKEEAESFDKFEDMALEAWMQQHRPELLKNYQPDGGYYVDVLDAGDMKAAPISDTVCWVSFDFSGRDLSGNIILTRRADEAHQVGSFTKYTRYVPYYRYCGERFSGSLIEGTYLAMRNTLHLDPDYVAAHPERNLPTELRLREGAQVVLYMPSRVVGSGGVSGDGGYEGQSGYTLDARRPFIVTMTICDTVKNPLEHEGREVDEFCKTHNGGLKMYDKDDDTADIGPLPSDPEDKNHPYNVTEEWVSANDTIPQVYINYRFNPAKKGLKFPDPYSSGFLPYADASSMETLETKINEALVKRFHPDEDNPYPTDIKKLEADSVKLDGTAKVWYIGRFLDGFIFDTNIDEVKELIYGEVVSEGEAYEYTPKEGGAVTMWYYSIPNLKYGQWAAVVATSTNGYGSTGRSGGTSSSGGYSSSDYYDYLNYLNYYNSYYGNNGYYNPYYGGYYGGYYNPYYGYGYGYGYGSDSDDSESVTTVSTEIPPFSPLIFELYIEPEEEE